MIDAITGNYNKSRYSTWRLQRLYDTGNYTCSHRRYGYDEPFHSSLKDLPISYPYLEIKLVRK